MIERYFIKYQTQDRIRASWLAEPIQRYVTWLHEQQYAARNVYRRVPYSCVSQPMPSLVALKSGLTFRIWFNLSSSNGWPSEELNAATNEPAKVSLVACGARSSRCCVWSCRITLAADAAISPISVYLIIAVSARLCYDTWDDAIAKLD